MKIDCECGSKLYDNTDYLDHKAYLVADQDYFDLWNALDARFERLAATVAAAPDDPAAARAAVQRAQEDAHDALGEYMFKTVYQCDDCGRLFVDGAAGGYQVFAPANAAGPKNLLRSVEGDRWKRPLRGRWVPREDRPDKGTLSWGFGDAEEGYEVFEDWESLERRYYEVLARLQEKGILRDAMLTRGGDTLHRWP